VLAVFPCRCRARLHLTVTILLFRLFCRVDISFPVISVISLFALEPLDSDQALTSLWSRLNSDITLCRGTNDRTPMLGIKSSGLVGFSLEGVLGRNSSGLCF